MGVLLANSFGHCIINHFVTYAGHGIPSLKLKEQESTVRHLATSSVTFLAWDPGSNLVTPSLSVSFFIFFTQRWPRCRRYDRNCWYIPPPHRPLCTFGGTILFSGYVVHDTYLINRRLSPNEYIMAAISLYPECVWCFSLPSRSTSVSLVRPFLPPRYFNASSIWS